MARQHIAVHTPTPGTHAHTHAHTRNIQFASVSAVTGEGMAEFFEKVDEAVKEFDQVYRPELERMKKEKV